MQSLYWKLREKIRMSRLFQETAGKAIYAGQILRYSHTGEFRNKVIRAVKVSAPGQGVALFVRIRDEALNLREFVEYYLAAGVRHIFIYEARSEDDFHAALDPFVKAGVVTLIENWPHIPISPAAEHDCVLRCIGRFAWMGCVDADEFVVVKDNMRIDEFLNGVPTRYPALALHWRQYGSNGHLIRPAGPVIAEYSRREEKPNSHVKVFVRPERLARYRNSHSWYYRGLFSTAVNEKKQRVYGSISSPPTAEVAWINHYHHKSEAEYYAKAKRLSILDPIGIKFNNRTAERGREYEQKANAVVDLCALVYHRALCRRSNCSICAAV
jgi:hypothetical protein